MQLEKATAYIMGRLEKELPKSLFYHSVSHVQDVIDSSRRIGAAEGISDYEMTLLLTAASFHDSGFMIQAKEHERISCDIARETLPGFGYNNEQIEIICGMIMATKVPQMPNNHLEQIICDADLDYLGRDDFWDIGGRLFEELKGFGILSTELEWNKIQVKFLDQHSYFTKTAIDTRKAQKEVYLNELKKLVS